MQSMKAPFQDLSSPEISTRASSSNQHTRHDQESRNIAIKKGFLNLPFELDLHLVRMVRIHDKLQNLIPRTVNLMHA